MPNFIYTDKPMPSDQEIIVNVLALAYGGSFVASTIDGPEESIGKKAFLREVIPGEKVQALIVRDEKRLLRAEKLEILEPSTSRVEPPCPIFGLCGGCDLQHMTIESQRFEKKRMVLDTLRMQAAIEPSNPAVLLGENLPAYNYRRRISMHLNLENEIGFFKLGSGHVVDAEHCLIASNLLNDGLKRIRQYLDLISTDIGGVTLEEFDSQLFVILLKAGDSPNDTFKPPAKFLTEFPNLKIVEKGECVFAQGNDYPAGHFSQINEAANAVLTETVLKLTSGSKVTELYAGSGNMGIPLAKAGVSVDAIEVDASLVKYGEAQIKNNGVTRIKFINASCEDYLRNHKLSSVVVLDPPRSGAKNILLSLTSPEVEKIIYISCNLPSLTRDLKHLTQNGFKLEDLYLVDMFPQTHHIETICSLVRI